MSLIITDDSDEFICMKLTDYDLTYQFDMILHKEGEIFLIILLFNRF